jgi:hypothetical protein
LNLKWHCWVVTYWTSFENSEGVIQVDPQVQSPPLKRKDRKRKIMKE